MRIGVGLVLMVALIQPAFLSGQAGQVPEAESGLDGEELVREWFARLNALDDWSPDNLENQVVDAQESEEASAGLENEVPQPDLPSFEDIRPLVESFVELYEPDVMLFVRPNQYQLGPVMYYEQAGVRKWADFSARTFFDLAYRINEQTAREITSQVFYQTPLPWGGLAVSVEFTAIYTFRDGEERYTAPGSAFFQFSEDGKIQRLRLYELKDETVEVVP
jgi:hypothetical protein